MFKNLYSIWLQPEGKVLEEAQKIIKRLAKQHSAPIFKPHITLLGELNLSKEEIFDKAFQLSQNLIPFTLEVMELDYTETYFKCVFIKAKESKPARDAFDKAREIFNIKNEYMIHLSLVYGNFDERIKKEIIKKIGPLNFKINVESICLTNSSSLTKPKDWQVLAKFPFGIVNDLKKGKIGVIPTDTIYGIVGSALNKKAVEKIYTLRKRAKDKPFIILISKLSDLEKFGIKLSKYQEKYLKKIWPNPVSVVLSVTSKKFEYLHKGKNSLAFRMPRNSWLKSLLDKTGPLVAPSANFEGEKPAETVNDARKYFAEKVSFYIDFGELISKPSTLIDLTSDSVKILRRGSFKI